MCTAVAREDEHELLPLLGPSATIHVTAGLPDAVCCAVLCLRNRLSCCVQRCSGCCCSWKSGKGERRTAELCDHTTALLDAAAAATATASAGSKSSAVVDRSSSVAATAVWCVLNGKRERAALSIEVLASKLPGSNDSYRRPTSLSTTSLYGTATVSDRALPSSDTATDMRCNRSPWA